jgi:hypothetical protein
MLGATTGEMMRNNTGMKYYVARPFFGALSTFVSGSEGERGKGKF